MQITEDGALVPGEINFEQEMKIVMTGSVGPKFTIYIYIYIPVTQMTLFLIGKDLVLGG